MTIFLIFILVLRLVNISQSELKLQINKKIEDIIYPVSSNVEEKVGTTFSLLCELVSTDNDTTNSFDDQLAWLKENHSVFVSKTNSKQINKCEKKFSPLQVEDSGNYVCESFKFKLNKSVEIIVRDNVKRKERIPLREALFCNEHMFQCMSSGLCIIKHYVCDGKADCKDGSDESYELCSGDPCRDKIQCDDGRCIPTGWCCDRHHDLNCTVTNRPRCCQVLSESYEELEYGFPTVHQTHNNGARYLFISVCIVSILFSIVLLLLIVSRVVIFAKKTAFLQQQQRNTLMCENIALSNSNRRPTTNVNVIHLSATSTRSPSNLNQQRIIIDTSDITDPLLFNPTRFNVTTLSVCDDQPPSYMDVLRGSRAGPAQRLLRTGGGEPPPPYSSRDGLDV